MQQQEKVICIDLLKHIMGQLKALADGAVKFRVGDPYYSGMEKIKFTDFKKFFARFETYFQPSDITLFLAEVELLQRREEMVDILEIASMIRNDIELMPK